jgi:hypothetical protein
VGSQRFSDVVRGTATDACHTDRFLLILTPVPHRQAVGIINPGCISAVVLQFFPHAAASDFKAISYFTTPLLTAVTIPKLEST